MHTIFKFGLAACVASTLLISAWSTWQYQPRIFLINAGSMEPTIYKGSLIVTLKFPTYQMGDVVSYVVASSNDSFVSHDAIVTHRIVAERQTPSGLRYNTKGDANQTPDAKELKPDQIIGKVVASWSLRATPASAYYQASQVASVQIRAAEHFSPTPELPVHISLTISQSGEQRTIKQRVLNGDFKAGLQSWTATGSVDLISQGDKKLTRLRPTTNAVATLEQTLTMPENFSVQDLPQLLTVELKLEFPHIPALLVDQPVLSVSLNDQVFAEIGTASPKDEWLKLLLTVPAQINTSDALNFKISAQNVPYGNEPTLVSVRRVSTAEGYVCADCQLHLTSQPAAAKVSAKLKSADGQQREIEGLAVLELTQAIKDNFPQSVQIKLAGAEDYLQLYAPITQAEGMGLQAAAEGGGEVSFQLNSPKVMVENSNSSDANMTTYLYQNQSMVAQFTSSDGSQFSRDLVYHHRDFNNSHRPVVGGFGHKLDLIADNVPPGKYQVIVVTSPNLGLSWKTQQVEVEQSL